MLLTQPKETALDTRPESGFILLNPNLVASPRPSLGHDRFRRIELRFLGPATEIDAVIYGSGYKLVLVPDLYAHVPVYPEGHTRYGYGIGQQHP